MKGIKYREENKETIKQYYEENKEHILKHNKQYRENIKDDLKEQYKQYRENNHEYIKAYKGENIACECGCIVTRGCLSRHRKSKKHIGLMNELHLINIVF